MSSTPDSSGGGGGGSSTPLSSSAPKPLLRRQASLAKDEENRHQRSSSSGATTGEIVPRLDEKEEKEKRKHHRSKSVQITDNNVAVMVAGTGATPVKDAVTRPTRGKGEDVKVPATLPAGVLPSLAQQEVEIVVRSFFFFLRFCELILDAHAYLFLFSRQKLIGRGATGKVYKAIVNKELRAMKVLSMVGLDPKKQKKVRMDLKTEVRTKQTNDTTWRLPFSYDVFLFPPST